jgi:hypothetical protein
METTHMAIEPHAGMVTDMAYEKVTLSLPGHLVTATRHAAEQDGVPLSRFVAKALRGEILRHQLAVTPLPPDHAWADLAEDAEPGADGAAA